MKNKIVLGAFSTLMITSLLLSPFSHGLCAWYNIYDGLDLGVFTPKQASNLYGKHILILKINPEGYALRLLSASEHGSHPRTAKAWCRDFDLIAGINASMYQDSDLLKSTGYMKNYGHFNNRRINNQFGAFLVFNPIDETLPPVQFIDRKLRKDWPSLLKSYQSVIQNYKMISHGEKSGWPQSKRIYSTAAVGVDRNDHILFILSLAAYSTHDLINILLSLPIHIESAMYLEGGPEATLYIETNDKSLDIPEDVRTLFTRSSKYESPPRLPNVLGIEKR